MIKVKQLEFKVKVEGGPDLLIVPQQLIAYKTGFVILTKEGRVYTNLEADAFARENDKDKQLSEVPEIRPKRS